MLDTIPIRTPSAARLIECPPRREAKPADPCALVIFGATGDLTKRLVVPALYNLSRRDRKSTRPNSTGRTADSVPTQAPS